MKYAVIDIESTGFNRYKNDITFIGVGLAKEIGEPIEKYRAYDMSVPDDVEAFKRMCKKLYKSKVYVVWQNGKFDTLFIEQKLGLKLPISEDVMVLATAYDLAEAHGLKAMAQKYLGVPDWDIAKKEKTSTSAETVLPYLKKDVIYTWEVFCYLMKRCNEQQLKIYYDLLLPAYKAYRIVERIGAYVDIDILRSVKKEYAEVEKVKLEKLNNIAKINWNSAPQIAELMYDKLDLPIIKKSKKTGKPSADKGALSRLAVRSYELPTLLIDYKKTNTLNKMFLKRWENDLGTDGRMHPSFSLVNVVTGRTSCLSGDTLVTVPSGYKKIKDIRPGDLVYSFDNELRLRLSSVTWSGQTGMRELYRVWWKGQGGKHNGYVDITGDHMVRLTDGSYERVDKLIGLTGIRGIPADRVMALHREVKNGKRNVLYATGHGAIREAIFVFSEMNGYTPEHVHHKDVNSLNDTPENLAGMTRKEHCSLHAKLVPKEEYSRRGSFPMTEAGRAKLLSKHKVRFVENAPTKEQIESALREGNGLRAAGKILGRDFGYVKKCMDHYGIVFDGRKNKPVIWNKKPAHNHVIWKIEKLNGEYPVYDLTVEGTHNFIANELCVHNCSDPNLQQVPREKTLRSIFRAPKGRVFFEADYSQLELRIAADYAQDRTMLEIYRTGGDIHTETAKLMTEGRQPTKDERNKAKAINFGFLYGMMARKFVDYAFDSYNQVFTLQEADRVRQLFFMKYAQLLPWHKKMELLCEANGGVANRFGRFRKIPNIYSQDKWERLGAVRRAINTPIQGTGSDLLVGSMMQLQREHSKNGLVIVGTVHDSIIGEFNEGDEDWMVPEIKRIMSHPAIMDEFGVTFSVPLEADVGLGPWGSK